MTNTVDNGMPLTGLRFWQEVYIAAIRSGEGPDRAAYTANAALRTFQGQPSA